MNDRSIYLRILCWLKANVQLWHVSIVRGLDKNQSIRLAEADDIKPLSKAPVSRF